MLRDVMIIDENVENIRIILMFLKHHQFLGFASILDHCVSNIDSISLLSDKYCLVLHS